MSCPASEATITSFLAYNTFSVKDFLREYIGYKKLRR